MDVEELLQALRQEFPDRKIILLPPEGPEEIIIELGGGPSESSAVALVRRSRPHFHRRTTETYQVQSGALILSVGKRRHWLRPGGTLLIEPGKVHSARSADGKFARVLVTASPPWSPEDHILTGTE